VEAAAERRLAPHYQPRKTLALAADSCYDLFVVFYTLDALPEDILYNNEQIWTGNDGRGDEAIEGRI